MLIGGSVGVVILIPEDAAGWNYRHWRRAGGRADVARNGGKLLRVRRDWLASVSLRKRE